MSKNAELLNYLARERSKKWIAGHYSIEWANKSGREIGKTSKHNQKRTEYDSSSYSYSLLLFCCCCYGHIAVVLNSNILTSGTICRSSGTHCLLLILHWCRSVHFESKERGGRVSRKGCRHAGNWILLLPSNSTSKSINVLTFTEIHTHTLLLQQQ